MRHPMPYTPEELEVEFQKFLKKQPKLDENRSLIDKAVIAGMRAGFNNGYIRGCTHMMGD